MTNAIGGNLSAAALAALLGATNSSSTPSMADALNAEDNSNSSNTNSSTNPTDSIDLSDEAKAYLAQSNTTTTDDASPVTLAINARTWINQQYKTLGIHSVLVDGKTAVDFSSQSRASLAAMASNAQGMFSDDESSAAATALKARFDAAMSPSLVLAQHDGDYTNVYQAASDYLDQASTTEQATQTWKDQKKAVTAGLAAAKAAPATVPDGSIANDPIAALIKAQSDAPTTVDISGDARAMLDAQAKDATDNGTMLQLDPTRGSGQAVDFSGFDNRTLASMVLNKSAQFSPEEVRAAKNELNDRTRNNILTMFNSSADSVNNSLSLLQQYSGMSDEEKQVLGITNDTTTRLAQSYNTLVSLQKTLADLGSFGF